MARAVINIPQHRRRVLVPMTPNYIRSGRPHDDAVIPIDDLDDASLQIIGEAWTRELIASAQRKRRKTAGA